MTAHHFTFQITDESDASDIREVETRAFGFSKEADLTASLLEDESARPALSLLARHEGKAVGHILFTRATFKGEMDSPLMHILAPLAVIPEYQDGRGRTVDTHWHRAPEVDGLPDGFCSRPRHLLPPTWVRTLCRRQRLSGTLSHPGGAQSLLDDASTHRSAHERDRPHPVRAGPDETGALA